MSFPTTKRGAAAAFRRAAFLLEKYGWIKGRYGSHLVNGRSGYCLLGVFRPILGSLEDVWVTNTMKLNGTLGDGYTSAYFWNDASHTTQKDVTRALRQTANKLEHGGKLPTM